MAECSRRVVTICSTIPKLHHHVQKVCSPALTVVSIDPPASLDPAICDKTDFLITDGCYLESLLYLKDCGRIKFVQNTWAGVDSLIKKVSDEGLSPALQLARHQHPKFGQIMAEYSVAAVINIERNMDTIKRNQMEKIWCKSGTVGYRCLNELTIGVLGMGQMGKCLAKTFSDFGCEVHGLVSTVRPRMDGDHVTKYFTVAELASMVAGVDYLINVLPSTPSTDNLLNRDILKACHNVGFVNIGRGNVIQEEDIISALDQGMLRAAVLDVFNTEPLPPASALWSHPRVTVTPHVAGESRPEDIAECFKQNLAKWEGGQQPDCLVDWNKLY